MDYVVNARFRSLVLTQILLRYLKQKLAIQAPAGQTDLSFSFNAAANLFGNFTLGKSLSCSGGGDGAHSAY